MNSPRPVAHAQFRHTLDTNVDVLRTEVLDLVLAAERAFPTLPLHVRDEIRHSSLHLFVTGHPHLVTMFKVRLLYRGWKPVGRIRIAEEVAVRPTVSRADDRNVWVSVASPAYNTRESLAARALAPTWHLPTRMGQSNMKKAAQWSRQRSASLYGRGLPYGAVEAHVAGIVHEQKNSSEATPSPERTPYETPAQWTQRKRRTQAMRNIEKRKAVISAVKEQIARTTRKQTGPKE